MMSTIGTRCRFRCWLTINWQGEPRKVVLWANRNGFFYVIDRTSGKFLLGKAFVKQTGTSVLTK